MRQKGSSIALYVLLAGVTFGSLLQINTVNAAQITTRSLTLQAEDDGGSKPGGDVKHEFTFTPGTSGATIGSIEFEYCTTAADAGASTCVTPAGVDTSAATLEFESPEASGFTINTTTAGKPYITRSASAITGTPPLTYRLANVKNPTDEGTFFVRITVYDAAALGGSVVDSGTVAASTAEQIELSGTMPESLIFCTGETISETSSVPDCTTATAGSVTFDQLFSPTATAVAKSQMAASTNAGGGYAISINGNTLESGGNSITAMASATASVKGTAQFGVNFVANTAGASAGFPGSSANIAPVSNGSDLRGRPLTGYNTADTFKFVSGETVADSASGSAGPTNAQIYTASYIVNVPGNQLAGSYTTTLTYICTPTF